MTAKLDEKRTRYDPSSPSADSRTSRNLTRLDGIRVLIVEDEADTREALSAALGLLGAIVVAVASASEALSALETVEPDVLLSDISMADMDGYALIRTVRTRERAAGRRLPAAALTAHVAPEDRSAALDAGFDAHLGKPAELFVVAREVCRLALRRTAGD